MGGDDVRARELFAVGLIFDQHLARVDAELEAQLGDLGAGEAAADARGFESGAGRAKAEKICVKVAPGFEGSALLEGV